MAVAVREKTELAYKRKIKIFFLMQILKVKTWTWIQSGAPPPMIKTARGTHNALLNAYIKVYGYTLVWVLVCIRKLSKRQTAWIHPWFPKACPLVYSYWSHTSNANLWYKYFFLSESSDYFLQHSNQPLHGSNVRVFVVFSENNQYIEFNVLSLHFH